MNGWRHWLQPAGRRLTHGALGVAYLSAALKSGGGQSQIWTKRFDIQKRKKPRYRTSGESLHPAPISSRAIAAPPRQAHAAGARARRSTDTATALPMISSNTSTRRRASSRMIVAVKSANGPDRMRTR
jgi:hypothetical protein